MIYIYKIKGDNSILVDTWDNGKFKKTSKKMNKNDVINRFNNEYFFTSESDLRDPTEKFDPMARKNKKDKTNKILINKFELSKAVNTEALSGKSGYVLIPIMYDKKAQDKKKKKEEDDTTKEIKKLINDQKKELVKELEKMYG